MPRVLLIALLLSAFALRLGFALTRDSSDASLAVLPDQREYLDLGRSLIGGDGLAMVDPRFNDVVRAFRMPGYPLFIAACGGNIVLVRVAQCVIDTSTVFAVIWLARRWLAPRPSLFAGMLIAFDPIHVYFSSLVLAETLFVALLAWGIACLARGRSPLSRERRRDHVVWWCGVVLLIASIYVRPSAVAFPTILVMCACIAEARSFDFRPRRRQWPVVTIVVLLTVVALIPWSIRNRIVLDRWIFTTTNDGFTLYDGFNRSANGSSDQSSLRALPLLPNLSEPQRSDYLTALAMRDARTEPMRLVRLAPAKLVRTWSPWPLSAQFGSRRIYVWVAACHAVPLFALALVGVLGRTTLPRSTKLLLIAPAVLITLMHAVTVGSLRYRLPAHGTLAILAAAAIAAPPPRRELDSA